MPSSTYFIQDCPICGRRLQIRVEYLGRKVTCQHCQGTLKATDPAGTRFHPPEEGNALLRRADELLQSAEERKLQARSPFPR